MKMKKTMKRRNLVTQTLMLNMFLVNVRQLALFFFNFLFIFLPYYLLCPFRADNATKGTRKIEGFDWTIKLHQYMYWTLIITI